MQQKPPSNLSGIGRRFFELIEFDEDEQLITEIRKHPFGLAITYITGGLVIAAILLIAAVLVSSSSVNSVTGMVGGGNLDALVIIAATVLVLLTAGVTIIGAILYESNVVFVTNEKIAQVLYTSIFNRKISQLNIGNVQDVTVDQNGFFARIFDYGTLTIETAGEQVNYVFTFAPKPYLCARHIISAHEAYEEKYGN